VGYDYNQRAETSATVQKPEVNTLFGEWLPIHCCKILKKA